jgi:hypothetical protein
MFAGRAWAYPSEALTVTSTPLYGRLLALSADIRLGRKGLPETNSLAYYKHSSITAKRFL